MRTLARRFALDLVIVGAAVGGMLDVALRDDAADAPRTTEWLTVPAIALVVLPLLLRRRLPFGAPAAVWLVAAGVSFVDGRLIVFALGATVAGVAAAFLLGNLADGRQGLVGLLVAVGGALVIVSNDPERTAGDVVFSPLLFAIAWLAGYALRERAAQADAAEQRAAVAEREREAAARLAVAEERARIARELHDVVAHSVSVMVLQIGAIRHRLAGSAEEERDALQGVEEAGRSALAEMRRLLGAMRHDGQEPELAPHPGLERLQALVEDVGRAGLPVQVEVEGAPIALPRGLDLSAYRIVQEGLTNVLKHAGATRAVVTIGYGADDVRIEVRDDGRATATADGHGHGLVGIRERVKLYGGELTAGRAADGGFVLRTRLPLGSERP